AFGAVAGPSPHAAVDSLFDASIAWLQLSGHARFVSDYRELGQSGRSEEARGDLLIEEGLAQAAQGNKNAAETVQVFLKDLPLHRRGAEAWVALAELAFHGIP